MSFLRERPRRSADCQVPAACQSARTFGLLLTATDDVTTVVPSPPFCKTGSQWVLQKLSNFASSFYLYQSDYRVISPGTFQSRCIFHLVLESLAPQIPHQRTPQLDQLRYHTAAHRGAGGGELGGRHQEHRAAAGPRGDVR